MAAVARQIASLKRLLTVSPSPQEFLRGLSHGGTREARRGRFRGPVLDDYLPTVSLTLKPFGRFLPLAFGACLITRPRLRALECFLVTVPARQCRALRRAFALASFMLSTFGTAHFGGGNGGGGGGGGGGGVRGGVPSPWPVSCSARSAPRTSAVRTAAVAGAEAVVGETEAEAAVAEAAG